MPNDNNDSWLKKALEPELMPLEKLYRLSPQIAAQRKQDEGITGNRWADNLLGGIGSRFLGGIGDTATFVGANNVGDFFQRGSDWIEERLKPAKPAEFSWDYLTSPEGLARGTGNTIGSMASILLPTAFVPGGAVGTIGRGFQAIPKVGKLFSSASPEMIGRWFASGVPEAAMEAGNWYRNAVANGMNPDEAWDKRWGVFGRNAAFLPISNAAQWGLFSKALGGRPILGGLGELGSQSVEEGYQKAFENEVSGLPNTWNPISMATDPQYAEQAQAMKEGFMGFLVPTLGGMGFGTYRNWANRNDEKPADTTSQNDTSPATGNENRGVVTGADGIDNFMRALGGQESGGNYDATNNDAGLMLGKYQISDDNWSKWAQDAGLPADAPLTPENQERVARHKMLEYYNKFGNWRDVAIAWYGGEKAVGYSEEAKNRPQYANGNEYPSINEYADSVMSRFQSLGGEDTSVEQDNGYYGEGGKGEGNYWVRNNGVSFDGAQPDLLNAIDVLAKKFYEDTGKQLVVTAGTNGDHADGEHSHKNGWKVDIADAGANGVGLNEDGALFTSNYEAQPYLKEFVEYGRSLGLGMNVEGLGTSNVHIDVALDGTQWDGNGEHAGGFNPQKARTTVRGNTAQGTGTVDENTTPDNSNDPNSIYQRLIADILNEETKPLFDATGDDETTRNILSAFAQDKRESSSGNDFLTLDSMFDGEGNFINSKANRNKLSELYSDELSEFGQTSLDEKLAQLAEKVPSFDKLTDDDRKTLSGVIKSRLSEAGTKVGGHFLKRLNEGDADTFNKALASLGSATATALPEELSTEIARLKEPKPNSPKSTSKSKTVKPKSIQSRRWAKTLPNSKKIYRRQETISSRRTRRAKPNQLQRQAIKFRRSKRNWTRNNPSCKKLFRRKFRMRHRKRHRPRISKRRTS